MNACLKFAVSAAFACGFAMLAPRPSVAMPAPNLAVDVAPVTEQAHAVRVCNRYGCRWTSAGHRHGYRYGWRNPGYYGGYRYGWRHPQRHYGYGWRHGHGYGRHWR